MPRKIEAVQKSRGRNIASESARWRRRKSARPQEILDAALKVFAERGFAAARLDEIAARAGVAKGTIYLYFDSKEAVFKALIAEKLGGRLDAIADMVRAHRGPVAPLLANILRGIGAVLAQSDEAVLPKIVIAESGNFPELARAYRNDIVERGLGILGQIISAGQAQGEFRPMPVAHAARLTVAPLLIIAIWRTTFAAFDAAPYDYAGLIESHIATLIAGFRMETAQ